MSVEASLLLRELSFLMLGTGAEEFLEEYQILFLVLLGYQVICKFMMGNKILMKFLQ